MPILQRLLKGPYPLGAYLLVVALGAALISGAVVTAVGWATYHGYETIPGAVHISETLFTGFLITFITGIVLHRHATIGGRCATLEIRARCPFAGIFALGLGLGALALVIVYVVQGTGPVSFNGLMRAKMLQGILTGFSLPFLFQALRLLKHPQVIA